MSKDSEVYSFEMVVSKSGKSCTTTLIQPVYNSRIFGEDFPEGVYKGKDAWDMFVAYVFGSVIGICDINGRIELSDQLIQLYREISKKENLKDG